MNLYVADASLIAWKSAGSKPSENVARVIVSTRRLRFAQRAAGDGRHLGGAARELRHLHVQAALAEESLVDARGGRGKGACQCGRTLHPRP